MRKALIGSTGFVGGNLLGQTDFDDLYHSKNIAEIAGKSYDLVVCAGVPASMWLANNNPEKDLANIQGLLDLVRQVKTDRMVLISSIAVYRQPVKNVDEDSSSFETDLAYGRHRRYVEEALEAGFPGRCHILRLPALFGRNLKKNFLYDLLNQEPAFMPFAKWEDVVARLSPAERGLLSKYYVRNAESGMYAFDKLSAERDGKRGDILAILKEIGCTSLQFTHSQSRYQFYSLDHLWRDIGIAVNNSLPHVNICSAPLTPHEIAQDFFGIDFRNETAAPPFDYDMRTKYAGYWDEKDGYQYSRNDVYAGLKDFFTREGRL